MANHLTFVERQFLYRLNRKGKSNPEIGELTGRHRSSVYRELERHAGQRGYRPKQAQRLADERRLASRRPRKREDPDVHQYVQEKLEKHWSLEQIAGRVPQDFARAPARWLSQQTIYDWIDDRAPEWQKLLRQFFPKGTHFTQVSHREVTRLEKLLNERLRKRLDYRTPAEILQSRLACN